MSIRCATCGKDNRAGARYCRQCGSQLETSGDDLLIGRLVHDRYRIIKVLGQGGMGKVYLASQQMGTATRDVAIKVLHTALSREERVRKRFYRECEVVIQLTHPNTIQFLDFGELDERLFIVMEYVDGPTLTALLADGPLPLPRVDHILEQIVGSLAEAHALGVVHRDLKPDNVMLTVRGGHEDFVKVCDFGIAQRRGEGPEITIEGTVIGTPQYMSPEQLSGDMVDARSDVYSLGLILFEMLTGERPFHAETPLQWAAHHTTTPPPSLDDFPATRSLPAHRKAAVNAALAKSADDRPQGVLALATAFLGREIGRNPSFAGTTRPPIRTDRSAVTRPLTTGPSEDVVLPTRGPSLGLRSLVMGFLLLGLVLGGTATYLMRNEILAYIAPEEAPTGADAGPAPTVDAGPRAADASVPTDAAARGPGRWLRIVHFERRTQDAANALGPPDGHYATIRPRGTLVLELQAGTRIASDGSSGPDIWLELDEARSGPYRADFGVDHHDYTTVGSELVGSVALDCDQFEITRVRYIRLKNRGHRPVYVDAVGVFNTVRTQP